MNILPSVGIGVIRFGMTESEVEAMIGSPDSIDDFEYIEGQSDWYREYSYLEKGLTFSFSSNDDFRLSDFSITGHDHTIFGQSIIGFNIKKAETFISDVFSEHPKYEDCTWGKPEPFELLNVDGQGLMLWFKSGVLSEIVCSYLFEADNETIIWPPNVGSINKEV